MDSGHIDCVYRGDPAGEHEGVPTWRCQLFERCTVYESRAVAVCQRCDHRLTRDDPAFCEKWIDPLMVTDRRRVKTDALRDLLAGAGAFLCCGGPSANALPLEQLSRRGVFTLCVNNMAGHARFRPTAFLCSDPPEKFSHSIWLDPGIMKFVPLPKLSGARARLRRKLPDGAFVRLDRRTHQCPNVWGFKRNSWLRPDESFFLSDGACWGNHKAGAEKTGEPRTVCTMLLAIRLLRYLGARRVFLVGVDFRMRADYGYCFAQARDEDAAASNNAQFAIVNRWLCQMQDRGVFGRFGLEVYNCNERSGLRAFPFVPFDEALEDAIGVVEETPDLAGWYEKG